jgi:hypothetical protein
VLIHPPLHQGFEFFVTRSINKEYGPDRAKGVLGHALLSSSACPRRTERRFVLTQWRVQNWKKTLIQLGQDPLDEPTMDGK